ncbi:hypothetical protein L4174_020200 [Photobacterium sp. CCB-ST2H9]|uniref:hypothetical protein n=1 Tax=Photobacterium sp. CCB-ST2H9 TaxID=2912855 RepID=UPI0020035EDA|nr:hypothetical protein [Photobacterium sp. CCB-ST2H9]UTM59040.1 hypothetical protein L4174_020200 [Photobacterium sp. CCB-ST2H9]
MNNNDRNLQQYQKIRDSIVNDTKFTTDAERLAAFMKSYCNIIKNEKPLFEWKKDRWEKGLRGGCLFFFLVSISISSAIEFLGDEYLKGTGLVVGAVMLSILLISMLLACYPERYHHRITETGIYVRSYRRGKKIRQGTLRVFLLLAIPTVIGLFLIMGPMVFAGAGAGALGVFSMATVFREKEPVEKSLPWESIFVVKIFDENNFFSSNKCFDIHFRFDLICDDSNFDEVKKILDNCMSDKMIYINDYLIDTRTDKYKKLIDYVRNEIPFLVK